MWTVRASGEITSFSGAERLRSYHVRCRESLASRVEVLKPHLNERQRRLWLGDEARERGSGGVVSVARAVGVAGETVRRGGA